MGLHEIMVELRELREEMRKACGRHAARSCFCEYGRESVGNRIGTVHEAFTVAVLLAIAPPFTQLVSPLRIKGSSKLFLKLIYLFISC